MPRGKDLKTDTHTLDTQYSKSQEEQCDNNCNRKQANLKDRAESESLLKKKCCFKAKANGRTLKVSHKSDRFTQLVYIVANGQKARGKDTTRHQA